MGVRIVISSVWWPSHIWNPSKVDTASCQAWRRRYAQDVRNDVFFVARRASTFAAFQTARYFC